MCDFFIIIMRILTRNNIVSKLLNDDLMTRSRSRIQSVERWTPCGESTRGDTLYTFEGAVAPPGPNVKLCTLNVDVAPSMCHP